MDTSHYLRLHVSILLLVLFHSYVFSFASKVNVYSDARRIKIDSNKKRFLSGSTHSSCTNHKSVRGPITRIFCNDGFVVTKINFADYGNPTGTCEHFRHGNCGAPDTMRLVKENCVGKSRCVLFVTDEMFGPSHCKGPPTLAVEATCTKK